MMTWRQRHEDEAASVHEQVDAMLDSEDSIVILMDGRRAINYARGFGLSACQLELLANDIERLVRTVTGAPTAGRDRKGHDQETGTDHGIEYRRAPGRLLRMASEPAAQDAG